MSSPLSPSELVASLLFQADSEASAPAGGSSKPASALLEKKPREEGDASGDFEDFVFVKLDDLLKKTPRARGVVLLASSELVRDIASGQDGLGRLFMAFIVAPKEGVS